MLDLPFPTLIGVIHLAPLPGTPRHQVSIDEIKTRAIADANTLKRTGFDAVIIENFGDAPFFRSPLPPASVAAMAIVSEHVRQETQLPIGVNALRNDACAALGIACAAGADFIRVNVHTGVSATDQGIIEGDAAESLRYRRLLATRVAILADVHVKHGTPLGESDIGRAAQDTAYRGLADGLIVTGSATGGPVDVDDLRRVREAVPDRRLFVGSGATAETVELLLAVADGVIVGTGLKVNGEADRPIDNSLASAFARAAGRS